MEEFYVGTSRKIPFFRTTENEQYNFVICIKYYFDLLSRWIILFFFSRSMSRAFCETRSIIKRLNTSKIK